MRPAAAQIACLVVEDDADFRGLIVSALERRGIVAREARSVGAALVMLEQRQFVSAVLIDLMMPGANGVLLLRRIRRDRLPVRVAVVTAVPDPDVYYDAYRERPDRTFRKPVDLNEVVRWVEELPPT